MELHLMFKVSLQLKKKTLIYHTQLKKDGDYVTQFSKVLKEVFMLEVISAEVTQLNSQITGAG